MPEIGEVRKGCELGYVNKKAKFIWVACCVCGKERWVQLLHKQPISAHCNHCTLPETREKIRQARLGIKVSDEAKAKMSKARKGKPTWLKGLTKETHPSVAKISAAKKGKPPQIPPWNTGLTKETHPSLAKMANDKKNQSLGANNPNWRGGTSFHGYSVCFNRQLKARIRQRDKFSCQYPDCGLYENGVNHDVHHIDYDKKNNREDNLITLCHYHNDKANGNRGYWEQYFSALVNCSPMKYSQLSLGEKVA